MSTNAKVQAAHERVAFGYDPALEPGSGAGFVLDEYQRAAFRQHRIERVVTADEHIRRCGIRGFLRRIEGGREFRCE